MNKKENESWIDFINQIEYLAECSYTDLEKLVSVLEVKTLF